MRHKLHIAIFLVYIFLGKFLAVDANGLKIVFSQSDISFHKMYCKKKNSTRQTNKLADFTQNSSLSSHGFVLTNICTSELQFELFGWEGNFSEPASTFNKYFSSRLLYLYLDNALPPPQGS
jgi:hypothetical protein